MFGDIWKQLLLLTLDLDYCQESNSKAYGRPGYQRQTVTLALAHACPLTAVGVPLSSLASSCPRACFLALLAHLHNKLKSTETTCGQLY